MRTYFDSYSTAPFRAASRDLTNKPTVDLVEFRLVTVVAVTMLVNVVHFVIESVKHSMAEPFIFRAWLRFVSMMVQMEMVTAEELVDS